MITIMITGQGAAASRVSGVADVERTTRRAGTSVTRRMTVGGGPWAPVLVVVVLLAVVLATAIMSGPQATRLPMPGGTSVARNPPAAPPVAPDVTATFTPPPRPEASEAPTWVRVVLIVLGVLVALALLLGVVQLARRLARVRIRPRRTPTEIVTESEPLEAPEEEIRAAVHAGLVELDDDATDPRRAVIGCWLRLEATAASVGTQRRSDDTPADLVGRMLAAHAVSAEPLEELAGLYRRARYAPGDVDEPMRAAARATLTRLRDELAHPPADAAAVAVADFGPDSSPRSDSGMPAGSP
jgi:uncharacterized protein DUF4129